MPLKVDDETHTYWLGNRQFDSVTYILNYLGYSHDYSRISSHYAERGRAVHRMVELMDKGTLDESSIDPRLYPYRDAYNRFLRDSHYVPLHWELSLYHKILGYAGTLDKVGFLNGRRGILDVKTSEGSIDPAVERQLCGYAILWDENYSRTPHEFKYALKLTSKGKYELITKYSKTSLELWLKTLDEYRVRKEMAI